jgi:hypothetical protein
MSREAAKTENGHTHPPVVELVDSKASNDTNTHIHTHTHTHIFPLHTFVCNSPP